MHLATYATYGISLEDGQVLTVMKQMIIPRMFAKVLDQFDLPKG